MGVYFGTFMAAVAAFEDEQGWLSAATRGIMSGVLFGVFMGWSSVRERNRWRAAVGDDLSEAEWRVVYRAATGGPVPADTKLREASARAASDRLKKRQNDLVLNLVMFVAFILGLLAFVLVWSQSPWWLLLAAVFVYGAYETWAEPRRLSTRVELLSRGIPR